MCSDSGVGFPRHGLDNQSATAFFLPIQIVLQWIISRLYSDSAKMHLATLGFGGGLFPINRWVRGRCSVTTLKEPSFLLQSKVGYYRRMCYG